jgi:hypothetical protein
MARESRDVWARRVARWAKSGLSCEAFAAREGVKARTLAWWRWSLRSSGETSSASLAKPSVSFVEVEPIVVERGQERIEVVLANGRVVRVPASFVDDALARVLAIAECR